MAQGNRRRRGTRGAAAAAAPVFTAVPTPLNPRTQRAVRQRSIEALRARNGAPLTGGVIRTPEGGRRRATQADRRQNAAAVAGITRAGRQARGVANRTLAGLGGRAQGADGSAQRGLIRLNDGRRALVVRYASGRTRLVTGNANIRTAIAAERERRGQGDRQAGINARRSENFGPPRRPEGFQAPTRRGGRRRQG